MASVKTNIGHTEAVSGLASLIKMVKSLEHGKVAPSINFELPNPNIDFDGLGIKIVRKLETWPEDQPRRVSVNNFGYGGTNVHVILEAAPGSDLLKEECVNGESKNTAHPKTARSRNATARKSALKSKLLLLWAREEDTVHSMCAGLRSYLYQNPQTCFDNLIYTYGQRRTKYPWSIALTVDSCADLQERLEDQQALRPKRRLNHAANLAFVFNGQGAQHFAMGRELMDTYPVYLKHLEECDEAIRSLGARWSILEELRRNEHDTKVNEVRYSMPMTCAVQISLVALLADWEVKPSAVVGHSTGEIAAAYACGAITLADAMTASYCRGLINAEHIEGQKTQTGGMLAVGLGPEEVKPYLQAGRISIACYNSPESVTLSGDMDAINDTAAAIKAAGGFARKLKVQAAFHSHHMEALEDDYEAMLLDNVSRGRKGSFENHGVRFYTAVFGAEIEHASSVRPRLWVDNMLHPVRFAQACDQMMRDAPQIDFLVEVGPHSALAGPLRQILAQPGLKEQETGYGSCLERGRSAVDTMQGLAGVLIQLGCPVNVAHVNLANMDKAPIVLSDLPAYPWKHKTKLWIEPRQAHDRRFRAFPRHDLLGVQVPGLDPATTSIWKHVIRPSELPWVRDHVVQSQIVYPGAGYIAMAIEAAHQQHRLQGEKSICGYSFRDIEISKALVIPDDSDGGGVEVQLSLEPVEERSLAGYWRRFRISSVVGNDSSWSQIATGLIRVQDTGGELGDQFRGSRHIRLSSDDPGRRIRHIKTDELFEGLRGHGIYHGPVFRNLHKEAVLADGRAAVTFDIADAAATMPQGHQEPHVIHPTTLDSLFLAMYLSLHASQPSADMKQRVRAAVPRSIKRLFIFADVETAPGATLFAHTQLCHSNAQGFTASAVVDAAEGSQIEIEGMFLQNIGDPSASSISSDPGLCLTTAWKRSFVLNSPDSLVDANREYASEDECRLGRDVIRATYFVVSDALHQLTDTDIANLEPHHQKYHQWMQRFVAAVETGKLAKNSNQWINNPAGLRQRLIDSVAARGTNGQLAMRVGKSLLGILRKEIAPLELMLQNNLLSAFYQETVAIARSARQAAALVRAMAEEKPEVRILEIGGGTAGFTRQMLDQLTTTSSPLFAHYTFTDISAGFFPAAREQLAAWGSNVSYQTLDIEIDPAEQGFDLDSYDIVVAGAVLHATKNLHNTLANVRSLLKDNGKLVAIEITRESPEYSLVFGTLPGWWLSEEAERRHSPNISLDSWDSYLKATGFAGVHLSVGDCEQDTHQTMSCFVAVAQLRNEPLLLKYATLLYDKHPLEKSWMQDLRHRFARDLGVSLAVQSLSSAASSCVAGGTYILFFGDDVSSQEFDQVTFNHIKALVTTCKGLLWVTAGSTVEATVPEHAIHQGLLRTARNEETSSRYLSLDLDPHAPRYSPGNVDAIIKVFQHGMDARNALDQGLDQEVAVRKSEFLVPRIQSDQGENDALSNLLEEGKPEMQKFVRHDDNDDGQHNLRLTVETPGLIDSLVFREDFEAGKPLAEDFVEVKPFAFGLNFKDVMGVMGMLNDADPLIGLECAGVVARMGPKCLSQDLKVGQRVACFLAGGRIASSVRTRSTSVVPIPDSMSFEEAAAIPVVFITAWYSLFDAGHCEPEDTILIHAGTGGVGQACLILVQWKGVQNIFVTAGTPEKREFLHSTYGIPPDRIFSSRDESFVNGVLNATDGQGVDIVINSLSGNLLAESFSVLAKHGRFVEIGKKDIVTNQSMDMNVFSQAASFAHVDVQLMGTTRGPKIQRILLEIFVLLRKNQIRGVKPIKYYSFGEISRALRTMQSGQHMGKLVVLAPTKNDLVKTIIPPPRANLDPEASYLIVGGTSGIGRVIAQFLITRGARHLLLVSRKATSRPVRFDGHAKVIIKDCDVSDKTLLINLLRECRSSGMPPIKGIVYCGMVLNDSILMRMSHKQWKQALEPKVNGTRNIHEAIGNDVDFFVMLSSLSGILGFPSQSNYAAGNTYQDALARHRTALGQPAVAIDLGSVGSMGYLADGNFSESVGRVAKFSGHRIITETQVLGLVEAAIIRPLRTVETCQVLYGMTGSGSLVQRDPRYAQLRLTTTRRQQASEGSPSGGLAQDVNTTAKPLSEQIAGAESSEEATTFVTAALVAKVADMFALTPAEVNPANALKDLGVDSLVAVELRNWLTSNARADVSIFQLLDSPSLNHLAASVVALKQSKS